MDVILDEGNMICQKCQTIKCRFLDCSAEWRNFEDSGKDMNRCGLPVNDLIPQSSFGNVVSFVPHESYEMKNIRKYQVGSY
jgi:hypothetical protein